VISVRVPEAVAAQFDAAAEAGGHAKLSPYVRALLIEQAEKGNTGRVGKQEKAGVSHAGAIWTLQDTETARDMAMQTRRLGNLFNQTVRALNALSLRAGEFEAADLVRRLEGLIEDVEMRAAADRKLSEDINGMVKRINDGMDAAGGG